MDKYELARKALESVKNFSDEIWVFCNLGRGPCGGGWDGNTSFYLTREEVLSQISDYVDDKKVFEGMKMKEIDLEEYINDLTMDACWPDGIYARVNHYVPDELKDVEQMVDVIDNTEDPPLCKYHETYEERVDVLKKRLMEIKGGDYTFHFTVESGDFEFDNNISETIELTAKEALGLLFDQLDMPKELKGLCTKTYGEDFIDKKADKLDFSYCLEYYDYGNNADSVYRFLDSWGFVINHILSGDITEENLPFYMEYFENEEYDEEYYANIEDWTKKNGEDE